MLDRRLQELFPDNSNPLCRKEGEGAWMKLHLSPKEHARLRIEYGLDIK